MQSSSTQQNHLALASAVTRNAASACLLIGLLQGGLLCWLYLGAQAETRAAAATCLFPPLLLPSLLLPKLAISSLRHLTRGQPAAPSR